MRLASSWIGHRNGGPTRCTSCGKSSTAPHGSPRRELAARARARTTKPSRISSPWSNTRPKRASTDLLTARSASSAHSTSSPRDVPLTDEQRVARNESRAPRREPEHRPGRFRHVPVLCAHCWLDQSKQRLQGQARKTSLLNRTMNWLHSRMSDVVQKLWGFCHTLRHDGVDYGDYIEQLTYLLFLKMADEKESRSRRATTGKA